MPKFVKKPQTQEIKADSTWANEQEDRIAASIDPLYDELDKLKITKHDITLNQGYVAQTPVGIESIGNLFVFKGTATNETSGAIMTTLPAYYRPTRTITLTLNAGNLQVLENGQVKRWGTGIFYLDGVSFIK